MSKTIAWVVNRLDAMGGGERLLLEGAQYYRNLGYRVLICTWFFDETALFNGKYENLDIVVLNTTEAPRADIISRALSRARTLGKLRRVLREHDIETVFVQGEYDVALVYCATLFSAIRYRFLIFGQIFQYPHDFAKYSLIFRRHLKTIVDSRPGYRDTIPLTPPRLSVGNRFANEVICFIRWLAVRRAERRFSFSRQIQWETEQLFGCSTVLAGGAFPRALLEQTAFSRDALDRYKLEPGQYVLSLSRLDRKKRIDLIIDGFARSGLGKVLVVAGAGSDETYLRQCIAESGCADRIVMIGIVAEQDMIPLKHYAALFVSMDIGDYDISPLEALAVGTPVLCPIDFDADQRLEALPAFVRVRPDADSVASAMRLLLETPPKVDRQAIARWSWNAYFDTLIRQ